MAARTLRFAVLALTLALIAGCDLPDNDARDPDSKIFLNPVVVSTTPPHQAIGVPATTLVIARFSQTMDASRLTSATFTMETAAGPVAGSTYLSADKKEAVFTPSSPLAYDTLYTATLDETLQNTTGQNLLADYVWTFTSGPQPDWAWNAPGLIETSAGVIPLNYSGPEVALDFLENACAVWRQNDGSANRVFASRSVAGGAWGSPVAINNSVPNGYTPQVVFESPGQLLAAWSEGNTIWFSRAGMTGAWQAPQQVATSPTWPANLLKLLVDAAGNALLFYHEAQQGAQSDNMYVVRLDTTSGWESPIALPFRNGSARFAMDPSGFATVMWADGGAILVRRYVPGTGWTSNETVDPPDVTRPNTEPNITMDGSGTCLAVWLKRIAGGSLYDQEIYHSRRTVSQGWSAPVLGPVTTGQRVAYPNAALSPEGTVALTWVNQLGWRCWASLQSPSGGWSSAQAIDMNTPSHTVTVGTAFFAGEGRIAVIGTEPIYIPQNEHGALWITEYNPGTGWGTPSRYRTTAGYFNNFRLAVDSVGRAAAVWLESDAPAFTGINNVWFGRFR